MITRKSLHRKAEAQIDAAVTNLLTAQENLKIAADLNDRAARAHLDVIQYHTEQHQAAVERQNEIASWTNLVGSAFTE